MPKKWGGFKNSDIGIGISSENRALTVERFHKADKPRLRSQEASRLGLSTVKKITDLQKGGIKLQSKVGEEATFRFSY